MCENINQYVKELRKSKGVTQSLISEQTGISLSLISKFDNGKCNISKTKLSKIIQMLSSDGDEFVKYSHYIYKAFGLQLTASNSDYGLTIYDLSDIDKLAKTLTYKGEQISPSNIALIKQLAQALAGK